MARQEYQVVLKDADGYEITRKPVFEGGLKQAKSVARYLASRDYANVAESTHLDMGSDRVEVIDEAGEVVWDMPVKA